MAKIVYEKEISDGDKDVRQGTDEDFGENMEKENRTKNIVTFKNFVVNLRRKWYRFFRSILPNQMKNDPRTQFMQLSKKAEKKIRTSTGFEPVTSRYRCHALTN